jgi:hypothetical protein
LSIWPYTPTPRWNWAGLHSGIFFALLKQEPSFTVSRTQNTSHHWGRVHGRREVLPTPGKLQVELGGGQERRGPGNHPSFGCYLPQDETRSLKYVWIDTCCIDKLSNAELMRPSTRCSSYIIKQQSSSCIFKILPYLWKEVLKMYKWTIGTDPFSRLWVVSLYLLVQLGGRTVFSTCGLRLNFVIPRTLA